MNIQNLAKKLIKAGIEENEAHYEIKMLLQYFCNYTTMDFIMNKELTKQELELISEKIDFRIKDRTPIQYIIGESWFMGEFYKVTPDVLIPRDETEILVRKAIEIIKENSFEDVLDIGTGSGCIACTIAKNTKATVLGVDISSDALRVALDNVTKLEINNRAIFRKSDLFEKIRDGETFDIIISNPPYIQSCGTCRAQNRQNEPANRIPDRATRSGVYQKHHSRTNEDQARSGRRLPRRDPKNASSVLHKRRILFSHGLLALLSRMFSKDRGHSISRRKSGVKESAYKSTRFSFKQKIHRIPCQDSRPFLRRPYMPFAARNSRAAFPDHPYTPHQK